MTGLRLAAAVVVCVLVVAAQVACGVGSVSQPGAPRVVTYRQDQTTTLLWDGRVLVTGGRAQDGTPLASAEIYDPNAGIWSATGAMIMPRYSHTASVMLDGRVLVTGGSGCRRTCTEADAYATAEVYDPVSGTWAQAANMAASRQEHGAVVMSDGRVLIAGGRGIDVTDEYPAVRFPPSLRSSELYDPRTGHWSPLPPMFRGRAGQHAAALWDGRVVMAGGYEGTIAQYDDQASEEGWEEFGLTPETVEIFDPATGAWTLSPRATIRSIEWVGVQADGTLLVAGGLDRTRVQRYGPDTHQWSAAMNRDEHADRSTLVLIDDTRLLASGGLSDASEGAMTTVGTASLLLTGAGTWGEAAAMSTPRVRHTAVRLSDGRVLVYGGYQVRDGRFRHGRSPVLTSEVYDPATDRWSAGAPAMEESRDQRP